MIRLTAAQRRILLAARAGGERGVVVGGVSWPAVRTLWQLDLVSYEGRHSYSSAFYTVWPVDDWCPGGSLPWATVARGLLPEPVCSVCRGPAGTTDLPRRRGDGWAGVVPEHRNALTMPTGSF